MAGRHSLAWGLVLAVFAISLGFAPLQAARASALLPPIYVDHSAGGANNGTSWTDARTNLQDALTIAVGPKQIWVAEGTYYPGIDRFSTFQLKDGVELYGGFPNGGGSGLFNARNPDVYPTILSCEIMAPGMADDCYHVVTGSGTDATAVLYGFVVTGGNANGTLVDGQGGGIYNNAGSPTLTRVDIEQNYAKAGGGIYNKNSAPDLNFVDLSGNVADWGGGMYNHESDPNISAGRFIENEAIYGGGMYNDDSDPTVNAAFTDNQAAYGAGMDNYDSSPKLYFSTFSGNEASQKGGGIYNDSSHPELGIVDFEENVAVSGGGIYNLNSNPIGTLITFLRNLATGSGGGMYNDSSNPIFVEVDFLGNRAASLGGGMVSFGTSNPVLSNAVFCGNTAQNGAGIAVDGDGSQQVTQAVFAYNSALVDGGALDPSSLSQVILANSILWGNTPNQVSSCANCSTFIRYCNVQAGCPSGATCTGNLFLDNPQFVRMPDPGIDGVWGTVDDDYGDLHLLKTSKAIDSGSNEAVPADTLDVDGDSDTTEKLPYDKSGFVLTKPRFFDFPTVFDTGLGLAPIVDMGPYEAQQYLNFLPAVVRPLE